MVRSAFWRRFVAGRIPWLPAAVPGLTGRLDWSGGELRAHVPSRRIAHSRLHPQEKEPWTVAWLERYVRPGDVVWDVGANIGAYTLIAARLGATAVAVEPDVVNASLVARNATLNGLDHAVTVLPLALGASSGVVALEDGERQAGSTHRVAAVTVQAGLVLAYALDDLLAAFAVPSPTLLKVDVDGLEADVMAGASQTLADERLRSVLVEIDIANGKRVVSLADEAGLSLVERHDARDGVLLKGVWYGVFERR